MFKKKLNICLYGKCFKVSPELYFEIDRLLVELKNKDYSIRKLRDQLCDVVEENVALILENEKLRGANEKV